MGVFIKGKVDKIFLFLVCAYALALTCSMGAMELLVWITVTIFIFHWIWKRSNAEPFVPRRLGPDYFIWGLWVVIVLGALLISEITDERKWGIPGQGRWVLTLYALSAILWGLKTRLSLVLKVFSVGLGLVAVFSIFQVFTGVDPFRSIPYETIFSKDPYLWRAKGFFTNTMTYSYSFSFPLFLLLGLRLFNPFDWSKRWLQVTGIACALLGISLFLSFTRGAWLGIATGLVFVSLVYSKRAFILTAAALISFVTLNYFFNTAARDKFHTFLNPQVDSSITQRFDLWRSNWAIFKDHPLIGIGYKENEFRIQEYHIKVFGEEKFQGHAHNIYLQFLASTGILGFTCYMAFMACFFWMSLKLWWYRRSNKEWSAVIGLSSVGGYVAFHVGGLTEATFIDGEIIHMFVFITSIMLVAYWARFSDTEGTKGQKIVT